MVVKEKNYSERVDKILTDNKKYNEELQRRSATLELMASSHPFRVLRVEGDKNTQWDHGKPTYDKYTREIMIEEWPSIETLKVIKFDSAQPDLEKGDEFDAYFFDFSYHPRKVDFSVAECLFITERVFEESGLLAWVEQRDKDIERLEKDPTNLTEHIRQYNRDINQVGLGVWIRRPLQITEQAFAISKVRTKGNRTETISGPFRDRNHQYFNLKESLELQYKK